MSRIQKKKTVKDKKKRDVGLEDLGEKDRSLSDVKPASSPGPVPAKSEKTGTDSKPGESNFFQRAMEFLREVKVELKKVTWPTRKQTTGTTIVVIIFVFVVAAFLGLFDYSLSKLVQVVLT